MGGGEPGGGNQKKFWRPAILEACNGEDPQVAGIGEDKGEVEGGSPLEEGEVEGGPLLGGLEGLEWGTLGKEQISGTGQGSGTGVSSGAGEKC